MFLIAPTQPCLLIENKQHTYFPVLRLFEAKGEGVVFPTRILPLPDSQNPFDWTLDGNPCVDFVLCAAFTKASKVPWGWSVGLVARHAEHSERNEAVLIALKSDTRTPQIDTLNCWCHLDNAILFKGAVQGSDPFIESDIQSHIEERNLFAGDVLFWILGKTDASDLRGHRLEFGVGGIGLLKVDIT